MVEAVQTQFYDRQSLTKSKEMEIQELKFEIEQARRNEQMTGNILQEQEARQELLQRDQGQLQELVAELKEEFESLQSQFLEQNESYQKVQARIVEVDEDLTVKRRELFAIGQSQSSMEARAHALETQTEDLIERENNEQLVLNELREKKLEFEERQTRIQGEAESARAMQVQLAQDVESLEVNKKALSESVIEKKHEVDTFKDELNQVASRLYGLENLHSNFEGFSEGVKQVMLWQKVKQTEVHADGSVSLSEGSVPQFFQPVSEVVEVPSDFEMAMEAALGSRLQMLLATDGDRALQAVDYLKESKLGRSSFFNASPSNVNASNANALDSKLVAESAALSQQVQSEPGVRALLKNVVQANEQFQSSVQYLLDKVAVVDSIRTALNLDLATRVGLLLPVRGIP